MNNKIILVTGKTASGKSACLRNLKDQQGVWYFNCESNKGLPFSHKFKTFTITDPLQVITGFAKAEEKSKEECHTIVIDTATYMMDMYESLHVITSEDTRSAWGEYAQFWKTLMQQCVAKSTKRVIILAHTSDEYNEKEMRTETLVKVKGSLMNQGIESYFSTVISTKKIDIDTAKKYAENNPLLTITERDEIVGFKHVFQTQLTRETANERIRSHFDMWATPTETYIDNDIQLVLDRFDEYYGVDE